MDVFDKIVEIIAEVIPKTDPMSITEDTNLRQDICASSLDFLEMICWLEADFDIPLEELDFDKIITVRDMTRYVQSNIEARSNSV